MRITAIRLAIFGLGLAATPALAQMYGQVQTAPLPGSPVYVPPAAPPPGYAAPVTPAPGVGVAPGTVYSPTVAPAPTYVPTAPPTGSASITHNAPGVGEALRMNPAPTPVAPVYGAPVMAPVPMQATTPNPALPMQGEVLNGGDRTAAVADTVAPTTSPVALLGQAEQAARQGRLPLASELVERAESLLLTRSTIAGTESIPVREGAVARMAQARVALGRGDVNTATALMAEAASMTRTLGM